MHRYHDVAIVGVHNTVQARRLPDADKESIHLEAALGALGDAGIAPRQVDVVIGELARELVITLRMGPCLRLETKHGIANVLEAADLIASGRAEVVLLAAGNAGTYAGSHAATAPWTRPAHEFVVGYGMFTAAEFALMARRHFDRYGTTPEQIATAAATIRNFGHINPDAVYYDKGPFAPSDILESRMVADPFHLLDCATTSEGGCGIVLTRADRIQDSPRPPVWILGGEGDCYGPAYQAAPAWDFAGRSDVPAGWVGRRAAQAAFRTAGLTPTDVDVCEFYDPFSFEIIRQLEAFGFCEEGEGGAFVTQGGTGLSGSLPVTTDGGTMSFSHPGGNAQQLQRVIRGVQQIRGTCSSAQVPDAEGRVLLERWFGGAVHRGFDPREGSTVSALEPQPVGIPLPTPSLAAMPYWEGCRSGRLLYQRCEACGTISQRPTTVCGVCLSRKLSWSESRGVGNIYSWTVVWRPAQPTFKVPYAPAIVELEEGFLLLSSIIGCSPEHLVVGLAVSVEFVPMSEEISLPYFRPRVD